MITFLSFKVTKINYYTLIFCIFSLSNYFQGVHMDHVAQNLLSMTNDSCCYKLLKSLPFGLLLTTFSTAFFLSLKIVCETCPCLIRKRYCIRVKTHLCFVLHIKYELHITQCYTCIVFGYKFNRNKENDEKYISMRNVY